MEAWSAAAAATLAGHGEITAAQAATCTVLTSIASMMVNLPIIYRQIRNGSLIRKLALLSTGIGLFGLAVLGVAIQRLT